MIKMPISDRDADSFNRRWLGMARKWMAGRRISQIPPGIMSGSRRPGVGKVIREMQLPSVHIFSPVHA